MWTNIRNYSERFRPLMLFGLLAVLPVHAQQSAVDDLVAQILHDVVDGTIDAARRDVREHTGIDLLERGYETGAEHRSFSPAAPAETRRELEQVRREHDREIVMLEEELHRKLERARAEFKREAAKEDKPEKVMEKRRKLERKVEAAYTKFNDKVEAVNARSDEKRDRILSKERGGGRGGEARHGSDEGREGRGGKGRGQARGHGQARGRGQDRGHGQDHGRGVDDLIL